MLQLSNIVVTVMSKTMYGQLPPWKIVIRLGLGFGLGLGLELELGDNFPRGQMSNK